MGAAMEVVDWEEGGLHNHSSVDCMNILSKSHDNRSCTCRLSKRISLPSGGEGGRRSNTTS